jgi:hypothetical protein
MDEDLIQACLGGYGQATLKNYNFAWGVWSKFLRETSGSISDYADLHMAEKGFVLFLQWMLQKGVFSTALFLLVRSAVSSLFRIVFSGKEFGTLYQARLLERNIRKEKPREAKYKEVFDITLLLNQYRRMGENTALSDGDLRAKVGTMLMLYIMLRPVDMLRMDMSAMVEVEGGLHFSAVIKNAPEYSECVLASISEKAICPVAAVLELWRRVNAHSKGKKGLFFDDIYDQPLNKYNLERDMERLMLFAGVPQHYTPYSIKHASMTFLIAAGVDETWVNRNARLSRRTSTAVRHYFVGQACKRASQAIATAHTFPILDPLAEGHVLPVESIPIAPEDKQAGHFPPFPTSLSFEAFQLSTREIALTSETSLTQDVTDVDPFLFNTVYSVLSVSFLREGWSSPQGCGVGSGGGREQLLGSTCVPHVGSMSPAPDSPPKSPIPALSM